jgi:hypothetical protein
MTLTGGIVCYVIKVEILSGQGNPVDGSYHLYQEDIRNWYYTNNFLVLILVIKWIKNR